MTTKEPADLLRVSFNSHDLGKPVTVAEYFTLLAKTVWREGECFSGKRPFGNGNWQYEVYAAMIQTGFVIGLLDSDGCVSTCDTKAADALIYAALDRLGSDV